MGDLLLVRHGETEWSRSGQHTSYTDLPLTEQGREQARAVAPLLTHGRLAAVFVSPMRRARETAALCGLHDVRIDADLREWDYGGDEGVSTPEIRRSRPGWFLFTDGVAPGPPEHPGESPAQVGARADRMLGKVREVLDGSDRSDGSDGSDGDVLLVAHGHFLRVLAARYLGLAPSAGALFQLQTGTLSRLGTEHDRPVVVNWNVRPGS